jgi:tetratricopeptide (TPR) repeat protein
LKIDEAIQGKHHPDVARDVGNLGRAFHALGDLTRGRVSLERAQKIDQRHFGRVHPAVAADLSNLGLLLVDQGDLDGARESFERSLRIREELLGEEHPSTKRVRARLNNIGRAAA